MMGLQQWDTTYPFDLDRTKIGHGGLASFPPVEQYGRSLELGSRNTQTFSGIAQLRAEQDSSWGRASEGRLLTRAAQALLPHAHQHDVAEVAVGWFLKMLHGPGVPAVPLGALWA